MGNQRDGSVPIRLSTRPASATIKSAVRFTLGVNSMSGSEGSSDRMESNNVWQAVVTEFEKSMVI